ncbi:MAG: aminotransferase class V-fold PLP-dependent enzyme, partial [Candidatus Binatia bacterium]
HIITCATEHKAVLDSCKALERHGYRVTYMGVDPYGFMDLERLRETISDETILISIMLANNEIGTIHPLKEISQIAKEKGVIFHCDATQGVGKIPTDVGEMGIDLLSMTAHKIYGPKGIGALYVRSRNPKVQLSPILEGGGHERGIRSGTLNVPGIVGLGKACQVAQQVMPEEAAHHIRLREKLKDGIFTRLDEVYLNGHPTQRLPGNLNVSFAYVDGESLLMGLKEIAVSSGSTCTSASLEPSYVLRALGVRENLANSSIRFGLGRFNTEEEVDYTIERIVEEVSRLRAMSPLYKRVQRDSRNKPKVQPKIEETTI